MVGVASPAVAPETIVVDHGKIYVGEHLTSVCRRMGISIQPVRLRTGRDKGPIERFFRTLGEDLLQALPGYKGPDVYSRGVDPQEDAFFFLHELEAICREWCAAVYHHRPHDGLVGPHVPGLRLSPAAMFEHGLARAGYIEVPRDPDLAYEFLDVRWRTIQHYGVEMDGAATTGPAWTRTATSAAHTPVPTRGNGRSTWIRTTRPGRTFATQTRAVGPRCGGNTPPRRRRRSVTRRCSSPASWLWPSTATRTTGWPWRICCSGGTLVWVRPSRSGGWR